MGQILILLAQKNIESSPKRQNTRLQVEENVGEDIHIHFRELRLELTKGEFKVFASTMKEAYERLLENEKVK